MRSNIIFILISTLFAVTGAAAQNFHISGAKDVTGSKPEQEKAVDQVLYRITYKTQFVSDTTDLDSAGNYDYDNDEMALDIGEHVSKFYSMLEVRFNKWVADAIKRGGEPDPNNPQPPGPSISWISFYNYPEGKNTTLWSEMNSLSRIEEPVEPVVWQLRADTCTLLGYHCSMAEAEYKGRRWCVWYTEDIPISQGPWQLGGLPGLILKASDSRRQWIFTATAMQQIDGKEDITLGKKWKKYEPIEKKKFYQWRRRTTLDDMQKELNATAGVKITYINADGEEYSPEEYRKEFMRPEPFNPLDLSE